MKKEYYFCERYSDSLLNYLTENRVKAEEYKDGNYHVLTFKVYSNHRDFENVMNTLHSMKMWESSVTAHYTQKELSSAKWLTLHACRQKIDVVNEPDAYEYEYKWESETQFMRGNHVKQIVPFIIAKEPQMKSKTAFYCESTGFAERFADKRVYELVSDNMLSGVKWTEVLLRNGSSSENLY